jgi:exodeoxyribonuclease VII large subunit
MAQFNLFSDFEAPILSVTQLNFYLRQLMESDDLLQRVWIKGEVSNVSTPRSGHIYFTLKDAEASLQCVIWKSNAARVQQLPREGMAIEARGYVSVYERGGNYQLYVDNIRVAGEGELFQEFLALKSRLEAEGLFDVERKRPLPPYPRTIGIVTSATGAAYQDIINTLKNRYPLAEVLLSPAAVQGDKAPPQIIKALQALYLLKPDVILVGRGGGSLEDLWCFNDESVVRVIAGSPIPIVSGVGHETDFTLSDFAADVRAPTPTGAAVLATPHIDEMAEQLINDFSALATLITQKIKQCRQTLNELAADLRPLSPLYKVASEMQHLDHLEQRLYQLIVQRAAFQQSRLSAAIQHLNALNPSNILRRGYAILQQPDGQTITTVQEVQVDEAIQAVLHDGRLTLTVNEKNPKIEGETQNE